ncbi:amino acid adenylation domain-containing protein, partial [Xenorhabdus sp. SGI246]|uniref:amino acid adenylation domain-containing protein n=1 Tax=Xenorhabdus sp. SGI246 TaxID=3158263 RepID=UPI00349F4841
QGVSKNVPVALHCQRDINLLIAILGIFKAGGCYVPLDPEYPHEYMTLILEDAKPKLVLTSSNTTEKLNRVGYSVISLEDTEILSHSSAPLKHHCDPEQLAYIMYTSGSTGNPKGVMVPHRQLLNCLHSLWNKIPFGKNELVAQKTSIAFAISVKELLSGLLIGTPLHFFKENTVKDIPTFVEEMEHWKVTRLYTMPSQLESILTYIETTPKKLANLDILFISAEPCSMDLLERVRTLMPWVQVWYIYGCTEINDISYSIPEKDNGNNTFASVGYPIANTRVFVLDNYMQLLPVGIMGELYIESDSISQGYLNMPGLTSERFIANPFDKTGGRLYRTGDIGRYLENGALELIGRRDHEIKIRGYYVDFRQIEKIITTHSGINEVSVVGWQPKNGEKQLLAYIAGRQLPTIEELRLYLNDKL